MNQCTPPTRNGRGVRTAVALAAALSAGITLPLQPAAGQVLTEDVKFFVGNGGIDKWLGWSIAIDNGIVAVGGVGGNWNGQRTGSAYTFNASSGAIIKQLRADDGAQQDEFGDSIAIENNLVVVGARFDDDNGNNSGSAYLFDAFTGDQLLKLLPDDGQASDTFGTSVAIENGIIAIGASGHGDGGAVYLFDAATGLQLDKLTASDGQEGDSLGAKVAMDSGILAVGAPGHDVGDESFDRDWGAAYLFDVSTGEELLKLQPVQSDGSGFQDKFGSSIDIDNGVVAVGEPGDEFSISELGLIDAGAVHLFDASTGQLLRELRPDPPHAQREFGSSVSISNGIVAVGEYEASQSFGFPGNAYVFDATTGEQLANLIPSDGVEWEDFGFSVSIKAGVIAVGKPREAGRGSAYIFDINDLLCSADIANAVDSLPDGTVDVFDLLALLSNWGTNGPGAGIAEPTEVVDVFDLLVLLSSWGDCQ